MIVYCKDQMCDWRVRTFGGKLRHFLLDVKLRESTVLEVDDVKQMILATVLRLVGEYYLSKMELEVNRQSGSKFIISVQKEFAVIVRSALVLPIVHIPGKPVVEEVHILQESSFIQPLIHSSRRFFEPLTE